MRRVLTRAPGGGPCRSFVGGIGHVDLDVSIAVRLRDVAVARVEFKRVIAAGLSVRTTGPDEQDAGCHGVQGLEDQHVVMMEGVPVLGVLLIG